ncbi:MAG: hypothetical protein A4E28_02842 [Methanocella sp. PtaU1.Bin125]|nr:MAG: hypothetical protein A4E28_02842 [Methanocella sp. PtaU1.Bin125]
MNLALEPVHSEQGKPDRAFIIGSHNHLFSRPADLRGAIPAIAPLPGKTNIQYGHGV